MNLVMSNALTLGFLLGGLCVTAVQANGTGVLQLELQAEWQGSRLPADFSSALRVERLDLLLSGLALQRTDGTWLESDDWQAFASLGKASQIPPADGIPGETFRALRFQVGLPEALNSGDPVQWAPGHPLHPSINGLHWGWQGGYVFLAFEGRWRQADGEFGGFSFHLATDERLTTVELPLDFQGGGPLTVRLALDASRLLEGIDFARDGAGTHSRPGDSLAGRLQTNLARAFRVVSLHPDLFQTPGTEAVAVTPPAGAAPFRLDISHRLPQAPLPADNPLTLEGVALGEKLFHDPRLSINNRQSCASCHDRSLAFSDSRRVSVGAQGQTGSRQSMPLFNLAWSQSFFWDGRATSLREQVLMPIQDPHEMNESLERVTAKLADEEAAFAAAFGTPEVSPERVARALEQYLLTLISQDSRFDQAARKVGALSEEEKRGLQLFVTEHDPARGLYGADCFHCHGGTLFTDHQFKNNGLDLVAEDVGLMAVTGKTADHGKFKTPSLRNIAVTAPYMHDGRFETLEEVVAHYNGPLSRSDTLDPNLAKHPASGLQLSAEDQRALVAFLKTLTDDAFIASPAEFASRP